jgi:catechol 2,3-dioxygenase-like lactoylglutathione lyase family enzyme
MRVNSSAVSLNVADAAASSRFLQDHFGFVEEMAADGFASLTRDDVGMNVVFLAQGMPTLSTDQVDMHVVPGMAPELFVVGEQLLRADEQVFEAMVQGRSWSLDLERDPASRLVP